MSAETHEPGVYRTPEQQCMECGHRLDAIAAPGGDTGPPPQDGTAVTVCLHCGAVYAVAEGLRIRELTIRERAELAGDHDAMRELRAVHRGAHFARRAATVH